MKQRTAFQSSKAITAYQRGQALTTYQRGQALVDYVVAGAIVTALVTIPLGGDRSALQFMLDSIQEGWVRFLAALSLPM
jgi:hypothetical protein